MRVTVTFRHVHPSEGLRHYAEEKVERLGKFVRRPVEAHIILSVEKQRQQAEIQITGNRLNINATEETGDLYSAIDLALDKVERQLKKHVAKRKDRKGANSSAPVSATIPEPHAGRPLIRRQRVAVEPMSVGEAVMQLKLAKSDFLLFKNVATDSLSVLYRRRDGNFGLIEPEAP